MKRLFTFFSLCLTLTLTHAQQIDSIRYVLDSAYAKMPFCANILITQYGKTVLERSYGYADAPKQKLLTGKNSFQVASISKQFTAYGIMQLYAKGQLHYDSLVSRYIPRFPYNNITVRHLLHHTSGLPDFWNEIRPNLDTTKSNGNKEMLNYLATHAMPLQCEPGSRFAYADIGYDLLALIIEQESDMSYEAYMNDHIFKPLKMKETYAYMVTDYSVINNKDLAPGQVLDTATRTFEYAHLLPRYHFVFYLGNFYGDGSIVTSAHDLAIWDRALRNCTLLPCAIQEEAYATPVFNGKKVMARSNASYGFGWFCKPEMIYHNGGHPGNIHGIYRLTDKDVTFIFLSNSETPYITRLRARIQSLL